MRAKINRRTSRRPRWTRQTYKMVARVLSDAYLLSATSDEECSIVRGVVADFIRVFARDNANFDPDKFCKAVLKGEGI